MEPANARMFVNRILARSPHTGQMLADKLRKREVPGELIDSLVQEAADLRLIDDAAYAYSWIRYRTSNAPRSVTAINRELLMKGVSKGDIEAGWQYYNSELGDDVNQSDQDYQAAMQLYQKVAHRYEKLDKQVRYRRISGFLARKGFSGSLISRILNT
jgi:regulatory protein